MKNIQLVFVWMVSNSASQIPVHVQHIIRHLGQWASMHVNCSNHSYTGGGNRNSKMSNTSLLDFHSRCWCCTHVLKVDCGWEPWGSSSKHDCHRQNIPYVHTYPKPNIHGQSCQECQIRPLQANYAKSLLTSDGVRTEEVDNSWQQEWMSDQIHDHVTC